MADAPQFSITARNAMLDAIATAVGTSAKLVIYGGAAKPATCATAEAGTRLWVGTAAGTWAGASSNGNKPLAVSFSGNILAAGTGLYYRLLNNAETECHEQGTVSAAVDKTTSASTASGSAVLTFADTAGVTAGQPAQAVGIPSGTTVLSLTSTTVTLSANTTGVASGALVKFGDASGALPITTTAFATIGAAFTVAVKTWVAPGA
jgi:hypothetical protein